VSTLVFSMKSLKSPDSELQNIAETLNQKQLRRDHSHLTDDVIGRIIETRVAFDEKVGKKEFDSKESYETNNLNKR